MSISFHFRNRLIIGVLLVSEFSNTPVVSAIHLIWRSQAEFDTKIRGVIDKCPVEIKLPFKNKVLEQFIWRKWFKELFLNDLIAF